MKVATGEIGQRTAAAVSTAGEGAVFSILLALSFSHLLNDMIASLVPAIYPLFKDTFALDYAEVGFITLTYQCTASIFQPLVGIYTDRRPKPYSLAAGMGFTLVGIGFLSYASTFAMILVAAGLVGLGSAIFHPEASRVARMASGGQHGLAQSLFQVGGNMGTSLGPLLAAFVVLPEGQRSIAWFAFAALLAIFVLTKVGTWSKHNRSTLKKSHARGADAASGLSSRRIGVALAVLIALMFSKFVYLASLSSYYTFYLISKFHVSVQNAQLHLFVFLGAVAAGTMIGGPIGDRIGRKHVIWCSILGVLPFTLLLPYPSLFWTGILTVFIGMILASTFSAIVVYAQELVPGRVGAISGLFFGLAFGRGGIGAACLGKLADS